MKKIFFIIALVLGAALTGSAKKALLITHYGSSDTATIARTLDPLTAEITTDHPELIVTEAYISPVVRRNLARIGIRKPSPTEALMRLRLDGVDTVYIQSSTIIDGSEMQSVRDDAAGLSQYFAYISVGEPLLYSIEDFRNLARILIELAPTPADRQATIYVGHGNQLPSTATYALLDNFIHSAGRPDIHVSTIEGAPTVDDTAVLLRQSASGKNYKKIELIPLLLVAGNHTRRDIDGEFKTGLEEANPKTEITTRIVGLAENPSIRALYRAKVNKQLTCKQKK